MKDTEKVSIPSFKMLAAVFILGVVIEDVCTKDVVGSVINFNTGLTPRLENCTTRGDLIPDALLAEKADVLCLQELWFEKDIKKLVKKMEANYSYSYHKPYGTRKVAPCSVKDQTKLQEVMGCAASNNCTKDPDFNIALQCVTTNCTTQLKKVRKQCINCVVMSASSFSPQGLLANCVHKTNRFNEPGLLVLSKKEFTNTLEFKSFFEKHMTLQRGYIKVEVANFPPIVCTHLSKQFPEYFEYELSYENYAEQQTDEIKHLSKVYGDQNHILVGDFNLGPTVTKVDSKEQSKAEGQENYDLLKSLGYKSASVNTMKLCTFCVYNPLYDESSSHLVDHCWTRKTVKTFDYNAQRIMDEPSGGQYFSDHFGVKTTITKN